MLAILLASVFCFTQIAPGFLHHHCTEKYAVSSNDHGHSNTSVRKDSSSAGENFSSRCLICASQGISHDLYPGYFTITVLSVDNFKNTSFYRTSSCTVLLESGTSRAPPVGVS